MVSLAAAGRSSVLVDLRKRLAQLAGSATGLLEAVQRLTAAGVVSPADALTMATLAPARALGLESGIGVLIPGAKADLIVLEAGTLALQRVFTGGVEHPLVSP